MSDYPTSPGETRTFELLGRIHDGDDGVWSELYRLYHDELLFTIRMNLGTRLRTALESEDVLQSVAMEAFKALPRFPPSSGVGRRNVTGIPESLDGPP